jgi:hypothetical protein
VLQLLAIGGINNCCCWFPFCFCSKAAPLDNNSNKYCGKSALVVGAQQSTWTHNTSQVLKPATNLAFKVSDKNNQSLLNWNYFQKTRDGG